MAKLGIKRKDMWGGCSPCEPNRDYENEMVYPSLNMEGVQVEAAGLEKLEFGDEVTLTIKARVTRVGGQSAENEVPSMAFDVMEIESDEAGAKTGGGLASAYAKAAK